MDCASTTIKGMIFIVVIILFCQEDVFTFARHNFSSQQQKSRNQYSYCIRGSRFSQSPSQLSQSLEQYGRHLKSFHPFLRALDVTIGRGHMFHFSILQDNTKRRSNNVCKEHLAIGVVNKIGQSQSNYSKTRGHLTATPAMIKVKEAGQSTNILD